MSLSRRLFCAPYCSTLLLSAAVACAQDAKPPDGIAASSRDTQTPDYPLVIRIDKSALLPMKAEPIDEAGQVNTVILGTRAVGNSRTVGQIDVQSLPDRSDVSFAVRFTGQTVSQTVGRNGPALIYSRTYTNFVCTREVTFDPRKGLLAGPCQIDSTTSLVYDGFGSSRGRLGRRLISRIAQRRANASYEEARRLSGADNERQLEAAFHSRLDNQLAALNREMNLAPYVNLFFGSSSPLQLAARASSDCIYIGIGPRGCPGKVTLVPPSRRAPAPVEVWAHPALLGEPVTKVASVVDLFKSKIVSSVPQFDFFPALTPVSESQAAARPLAFALHEGWLVFGMTDSKASERTATAPRKAKANGVGR